MTRFIAHCDTENIASWTTMENLGMKRVCQTGGRRNKLAPEEEREETSFPKDFKLPKAEELGTSLGSLLKNIKL